MITLLLATRNRHKVRELRQLLHGFPVRFLTLDQFSGFPPVREDGKTFRSNAVKKAVVISRKTILPVLAEDSGLEVRALGGRPGIRSARFAGSDQDDRKNNAKLLKLLGSTPASRRQARYVCWMALAVGGRVVRAFQGRCAGSIAFQPRGRAGFGYDPLFIPAGYKKTMAQLGIRLKHRISHRARAAARLKRWLLKTGLSGCPAD
ncbi:MAG: RdgB/HAM1 family non-canonical purine NTP pyrophosphatase [Candidatus Omnitrophica bacterium]|nr:RdgB/HAM1 family non-canonical purine NTP pyrophosphatase [Candidatus Omnitrophota bacterium]